MIGNYACTAGRLCSSAPAGQRKDVVAAIEPTPSAIQGPHPTDATADPSRGGADVGAYLRDQLGRLGSKDTERVIVVWHRHRRQKLDRSSTSRHQFSTAIQPIDDIAYRVGGCSWSVPLDEEPLWLRARGSHLFLRISTPAIVGIRVFPTAFGRHRPLAQGKTTGARITGCARRRHLFSRRRHTNKFCAALNAQRTFPSPGGSPNGCPRLSGRRRQYSGTQVPKNQ